MANVRITQLNSSFLYEFARSSAPETWSVINAVDGVIEFPDYGEDNVLVRVTANEAKFDFVAYQIQVLVTYPPGVTSWGDRQVVKLTVDNGSGNFRVDSFKTNIVGTSVSTVQTLIESGSFNDYHAYRQQLDLERQIGVVFDYNGTKLRGTTTSRTDSKNLEPGGYLESFDVVLTTSRKQWVDAGTNPILGASVTVAGVKYRIATIVISGGHFELALSKHRGS